MIKTLYLRVVLTFSAVVVISVCLAFPIAMFLYTDDISTEVEQVLTKIGNQIVSMSKEFDPEDLEGFLEGTTELNESYALTLFDSNKTPHAFGMPDNNFMKLKSEEIDEVLQGQTYKKLHLQFGKFQDPAKVNIGLPLTVDGKPYALFISPKITDKSKAQIRTGVAFVLLIVLIIGSLLILIASRYIVSPIKKLTVATNRLARGNFNVNLKVNQQDEIGLLTESFIHMAGELKQLEQMRQDFVSNVSHEIQSPLTSIRGFSKALRKQDLPEADRQRYLEIIERESERLSRLSENLLKLASLDTEHHPFTPMTYDLDEQLRRVVVFYEPQWSEKQLELDLDLPRVKIVADVDQLNQVWINLLGNAIKFTPAHGKISVRLEPRTDHIRVLVQDTGIGIRKEDQERIFERFYKADASRQRDIGGNGLGLSIARKIIEMHQGFIEVQSKPGEGTLFTVVLPVMTRRQKQTKA